MLKTILHVLCLFPFVLMAQETHHGFYETSNGQCLSQQDRAEIKQRLQKSRNQLITSGQVKINKSQKVSLSHPTKLADGFEDFNAIGISNFVDHNTAINQLQDYNCGVRSYDTESGYNHQGVDYFSWPFYWEWQIEDKVEIIAAAPGTIIGKDDGNEDKSCNFNSNRWNAVYIMHADGSEVWYGHLKKNSLTTKEIGETVEEGEYLGIMASSGNSTGPHLHFELYDNSGKLIDPYAGDCNPTTGSSWWKTQESYYTPKVNAIRTHSRVPNISRCNSAADTYARDDFDPGDEVYFVTYFTDQLSTDISDHAVYRPDGSLFQSWQTQSNASHYAASYWYNWYFLPEDAEEGKWTFQVAFLGETYERNFCVRPDPPTITYDQGVLQTSTEGNVQWYLDEQLIEGATSSTYVPKLNGNYSATIERSECISNLSESIFIESLCDQLTPPEITEMDGILTSNYVSGNQWYLNEVAIDGAIEQNYTPRETGDYTATVALDGDCPASQFSNVLSIIVAKSNQLNGALRVYPSPAKSILNIERNNYLNDDLKVELYNLSGHQINLKHVLSAGESRTTLNISSLSKGVYIIRISNSFASQSFNFLKQ